MSDPFETKHGAESDSLRNLDHSSLKYARWQGAAWAVMFGAGENSFGVFGTFLKAPPVFFGYLSGIPQLVAPVLQVISANLMSRFPNRKTMVLMSVIGHVLCFGPLAWLALAKPEWWTHNALLAVLTLYYVSGHFGSPPWNSFIGDIVPSSRRGVIFAQISQIAAAVTLVSMLGAALALYLGKEYAPESTRWLFAGIFILSGASRFLCFLFIVKMREPKFVQQPEAVFSFWQFIRRGRESNFVRFVVFVTLLQGSANIAGPYFVPYCRYDLKLESWQWICINSSSMLAQILSLMFWGKFADRFGTKRTLAYASTLIAVQPLLWLAHDHFYYLILINLSAGVSWGGFNLATSNYVMEACSPQVRARCFAYYNTLLGLGIFAGSMVGNVLLKQLPRHLDIGGWHHDFGTTFTYLLVISSVLRGLSALLFIPSFKELRTVHHFSFKEWFFENATALYSAGLRLVPFSGGEKKD